MNAVQADLFEVEPEDMYPPETAYRVIPGFPDYIISRSGRVHSKHCNRLLNPYADKDGYLSITLRCNKARFGRLISRLVALAFLPNPYNHSDAAHIDHDRTNNHVSNLKWQSHAENVRASVLAGRCQHKMTRAQMQEVIDDRRPRKVIAADYGINSGYVGMIKRGDSGIGLNRI